MPAIDHLVYASPDLDEGIRHIEQLAGARAVSGGNHPGLGSRNALLGFDADTYFEIIGIDPDQPEPEWGRPFALRDGASPGLVAYAVHPVGGESLEDVVGAMGSLGFHPGEIVPMRRRTPDGSEITWRLTVPGDPEMSAGGAVPFAIDWGRTPSPAGPLPSIGALRSLRIHHPEQRVRTAVRALGIGVDVGDGPAALVAVVSTPSGVVEIS